MAVTTLSLDSQIWRGSLRLRPKLINPEISPIFGDYRTPFPNFYISTGTRDLLLSQSIQLANKLKANDELNIWEDLWHVFEWNIDLPESTLSIKQISDFFTKTVANRKASEWSGGHLSSLNYF